MELEEIDLNLLVLFKHMLAERSVSRVAEVLDLSQPAVSNALSRLRKLLGDELFLRTPAGHREPANQWLRGLVSERFSE